ncbi:helix-turn-helix domain-containing protein [Streptomyces gilvus]|uniref:helix-turn-helix domain-containing protein n=1 Tax=Streptomyces gilvus TaxID=2920937 RepID=UPI001F0D1B86|nr:helix-turn-helix transcriptional regulator [Streptomyces sp. CME 23]MCH5674213.1 helix-turn-helix domain-containing protein [Streptomyces sp. CME 23]
MDTTTNTRRGRLLTWLENGTAREIREKAGLSPAKLAERVGGISRVTLYRCEKERHLPRDRDAAVRYYEALAQLRDEQEGAGRGSAI